MKEEYKKSNYYKKIAEKMIKNSKRLEYIKNSDVRISYLTSDKPKKSNRKIVNAECIKVQDIYKTFINYDFFIVFYEPNMELLNHEQEKIVVFHELLHVGIDDLKDEYYIAPHDIEDFEEIINKYGLKWYEDEEVIFDG